MPRVNLDRMAKALRSYGVKVEIVAGAASRGSASFNPRGVVCHWTAGPRGTTRRPSLGVVTNGRGDLPGPLCQIYLDRQGVAVIVATGRANHAGSGGWRGLSGNSSVFGIEAECGGDGDWTARQREAYPRVAAALLSLTPNAGDERFVCGHNEWAPSRKIDIRDWPMSRMRSQVKQVIQGGGIAPAPEKPKGLIESMSTQRKVRYGKDQTIPARSKVRLRVTEDGKHKLADAVRGKNYLGHYPVAIYRVRDGQNVKVKPVVAVYDGGKLVRVVESRDLPQVSFPSITDGWSEVTVPLAEKCGVGTTGNQRAEYQLQIENYSDSPVTVTSSGGSTLHD